MISLWIWYIEIFQKSDADKNSVELGGMFLDHYLEI